MTMKANLTCTGIYAVKQLITRLEICLASAIKYNDTALITSATNKLADANEYYNIINKWPFAANLAMKTASIIANIEDIKKQNTIKKEVEEIYNLNINPITKEPLKMGITAAIVEYLIAKYDNMPFCPRKSFTLTPNNINNIKYAIDKCKDNDNVLYFLESLLIVKHN